MSNEEDGLIRIESTEQLINLAVMARKTYNLYIEHIDQLMTVDLAMIVKRERVTRGYTWRKIAEENWDRFDQYWKPRSNQLAGMALCEAAMRVLGEKFE